MSLADRYQGQEKLAGGPPGITCPHYSAIPGTKRCKDYLDGGACARTDEFMCVEWLKANGHAVPTSHPLLAEPSKDLFGHPVPPVQAESTPPRLRPELKPTLSSPSAAKPEQHPEPRIVQPFSKEELESFKSLGVEVCLTSEMFGEVWIVPEYTDEGRRELSVEHAATLCLLVAAFPGSKVTAFHKVARPDAKKEPA